MTDNNRFSSESLPLDISPTPSKSVGRSKTVRNLNSAGNKVKGFFNIKPSKNSKEERPTLASSASYGPTVSEMEQVNLQHELDQLTELVNIRQLEIQNQKNIRDKLQTDLNEANRVFKEREMEYASIEHSFFEYVRTIRATDDDLSTIRDSFKLLKYSITRFIMTLNKKADITKATEKFTKAWPNLSILDPTTNELEPSLVNLLAEKLVHEHLVQEIFNVPIYPGLKVNDAYDVLNAWLQDHESTFSVRLRQQMACVVAKSKPTDEIKKSAQDNQQAIVKKIYDDLADIYDPFLKQEDNEKKYYSKISDIVDKALKLTIAIRGQEVDIKTVPIIEGEQQPFEEETMTEVKGRTTGLVRFCICPTFIGGDGDHGFLEKGRVVISTLNK